MAMKPRSFAKTSTSLVGGTATAILNYNHQLTTWLGVPPSIDASVPFWADKIPRKEVQNLLMHHLPRVSCQARSRGKLLFEG